MMDHGKHMINMQHTHTHTHKNLSRKNGGRSLSHG